MVKVTKSDARVVLGLIEFIQESGVNLGEAWRLVWDNIQDGRDGHLHAAMLEAADFNDLGTLKASLVDQLRGVSSSADSKESLIEILADLFSKAHFQPSHMTDREIFSIRKALLREEEQEQIVRSIGKDFSCYSCNKALVDGEPLIFGHRRNLVTGKHEVVFNCLACKPLRVVRCTHKKCKTLNQLPTFVQKWLRFDCGKHEGKAKPAAKVEEVVPAIVLDEEADVPDQVWNDDAADRTIAGTSGTAVSQTPWRTIPTHRYAATLNRILGNLNNDSN